MSNIFRPFVFGKETFHPTSFNDNEFVMHYKLEKGGGVPPHHHKHMDEYFEVLKGEMKFKVNGETIIKKAGEKIMVPMGITHSIKNSGEELVEMTVKYAPCADTNRMFEILAVLDESHPSKMTNLLKYFYLVPKLGLKEFSSPRPAFVGSTINGIVWIMGKVSGWDKLKSNLHDSISNR